MKHIGKILLVTAIAIVPGGGLVMMALVIAQAIWRKEAPSHPPKKEP